MSKYIGVLETLTLTKPNPFLYHVQGEANPGTYLSYFSLKVHPYLHYSGKIEKEYCNNRRQRSELRTKHYHIAQEKIVRTTKVNLYLPSI